MMLVPAWRMRNTPADAGNIPIEMKEPIFYEKHPRRRGEYLSVTESDSLIWETPPQTRGI